MARSTLDGRVSGFVCFQQEDTMTHEEYEERRRALEEQHCADVALLNAAHEMRLRSLERVRRESVAGERDAAAPEASAGAAQTVAAVREPDPVATGPAPRPMRERYSVVNDLTAALPDLPEVFDRRDVIRVLGYVPARTTLLRALEMLAKEGMIALENQSSGGVTNSYRKLAYADALSAST
jgi:hypothetical protein